MEILEGRVTLGSTKGTVNLHVYVGDSLSWFGREELKPVVEEAKLYNVTRNMRGVSERERCQFWLFVEDGHVFVLDGGSLNGTFLNGLKLGYHPENKAQINPGDWLRIGEEIQLFVSSVQLYYRW